MFSSPNTVSGLILAIVAYAAVKIVLLRRKEKQHLLPPGPKPWPILGNIADLPKTGVREWEFWLRHKDEYGPISSVTALGTTIVVLNSPEVAFELLDKRSANYSSRPRLIFGSEMCGWSDLLATQFYNERFRAYRKPMHALVGTKAGVLRYNDLQEVEVHRFLLRVLNDPAHLLDHIRTEAGAIILKMAYGYTIEPHKRDPLVDIADEALLQFSAATVPGAWLVDTIPLLRHLPSWAPGTEFQRTAIKWKATLSELAERPMQFVRKQMKEQQFAPSYVSALYEKANGKMSAEEEYVVKFSAASLYTGGADTSVSVVASFFLAMVLNPRVQHKAKEEIDRVVGDGRLPNVEDRDSLPYVEAVLKEAFRWHQVAPMGLPHRVTKDDIYQGYLIPKDAIVIPNIWWFAHDPSVYPNPEVFDPSRFLGTNPAPNPYDYVFGFGRRVCPGKMLADASVWLTVARSLAVFNISKFRDDEGNEIEPAVRFSPGVISHPEPFKAAIKPRSSRHEELIRLVEKTHPWEQGSSSELDPVTV